MVRITFLHPITSYCFSILLFCLCELGEAAPPNILLILTDDQGWSEMSAPMDPEIPEAQSPYLETPTMARLMRDGMRFVSGYSPAPLCTPTRRSIQCGSSAARCGSEFRSAWVPSDHLTIPKALKAADASYRCAHFGKWGEQMISTPEECGYDASDGETGNVTGGMPNSLGVKGGHEDGPPHFVDNEDPKRTNSVTDSAIAFMKEQQAAGRPFYIQTSYYAVHLSVVATEAGIRKYEDKDPPDRGYTAAWAAMLEELDTGVGRLMEAIDDLGIAENTYVFFTSDNGGRGTIPGGDESSRPPNFPLTGAKHSLNEGGIRVPFIVRGPGVEPGSVCRVPVVGYDFLPTFVDLAGGDTKSIVTSDVDGVSFVPLLKNAEATLERPEEALFFHRPDKGASAIRQGAEKLMLSWNRAGDMTGRILYQVSPDPREEGHEITAERPEKADALQALLLDFLEKANAEKPTDFKQRKKGGKNKKQAE